MFFGYSRNSGNHKIGGFSCKRLLKIFKVAARYGWWLRGSVAGLLPGLIKGNNLDQTSSQRGIMFDERKENSLKLTIYIYGNEAPISHIDWLFN